MARQLMPLRLPFEGPAKGSKLWGTGALAEGFGIVTLILSTVLKSRPSLPLLQDPFTSVVPFFLHIGETKRAEEGRRSLTTSNLLSKISKNEGGRS